MKIIDKTPLHDEKGQLTLAGQIQGRLKYGLNWPAELEAQKLVIQQFDRVLEKGFVLIRNFTLPKLELVIPIILVGPGGITVVHVTTAKGHIEANGDQWIIDGKPASINLLTRVSRYARAVQMYLEYQKINLNNSTVEGALVAVNPGAQIDSNRPVVRVVRSDAIKQFGTSLLQARPVFRSDVVFTIADRIVEPHVPSETPAAAPPEVVEAEEPASRARAIFNASDESNNNGLNFEFDESAGEAAFESDAPQSAPRPRTGQPRPRQAPQQRKMFGMTTMQVTVLAVLLLCQICIVIGAGLFLFTQ